MEIKDIQKSLKEQKGLALYDIDELKYVQKPIGKALYTKKKIGRPKKDNPSQWSDKIKCDVCGNEFIRSNRSNHNKTKQHQLYLKMNDKIKKLLVDN